MREFSALYSKRASLASYTKRLMDILDYRSSSIFVTRYLDDFLFEVGEKIAEGGIYSIFS